MKKILLILLAGFALSACNDTKENNQEWYIEPITIGQIRFFGLIHSTFDCPTVKNGVMPNFYLGARHFHSFCTKCMNEELIEKWYKWEEEKKNENENEKIKNKK